MSQPPHDDPPTSDRLYTTAELEEFARQQMERQQAEADQAGQVDQAGEADRQPVEAERAVDPLSDPLSDPLTDPLSDPVPAAQPDPTADRPQRDVVDDPARPAVLDDPHDTASAGSAPGHEPTRITGSPLGPPPSGPPPGWTPPAAAPSAPPAAPAPEQAQAWPQQQAPVMPAQLPTQPPTQPPAQPPGYPAYPPAAEAQPGVGHDGDAAGAPSHAEAPRRFMTATDFLDRRDGEQDLGPATWGWRGRVRRWTGGLISPAMGLAEQEYEHDRHSIQKDFDGPRTIAFINPKGGAAKTTSVLAAGFTFGTVRGGGVVAWDNNETRGTLGIRGARSTHRNTTRELLEDLGRFKDVYQSRIGDLGAFVRSQGDAHFDVLASDERPDVTGTIRAEDFKEVHGLLERFYRIILVDTGNNMRAENWLAAADAADLLVVTTTVREDTGYSGLWMLDALQDAGYQNLKYKTITVMSDPSDKVDDKLAADLQQVYEQRTRGVFRVPYDPAMISGSVVPYSQLSPATTRSWLRACAAMAAAL